MYKYVYTYLACTVLTLHIILHLLLSYDFYRNISVGLFYDKNML